MPLRAVTYFIAMALPFRHCYADIITLTTPLRVAFFRRPPVAIAAATATLFS